jgi:exosortase
VTSASSIAPTDLAAGVGRWTAREVLAALGLVALGFAATWPAWSDMAWIASRDEEQSHVWLVPLIAAWLVWMRRGRLRRCPRDHRWVGPALVAAGWALHSAGDLLLFQALWHLGAVVVVVGCFLAFAGVRWLARLLPAFVVLAFAVPVPGIVREAIALPLQNATAEATRRVLDTLGVEASRTGNLLIVNGREVLIAEACNGLRMVFALLLVSFTFAYSTPIRNSARLLIVLLSPVTAIACNVIRLAPTVWVYGFVSESAGARMHDAGAWVMLPVAFLLLMGIFRVLRWAQFPVYRYTLAYGK